MGGILTLDIATTTGFAFADDRAIAAWPMTGSMVRGSGPIEGVVYGSKLLSKSDPCVCYSKMRRWLNDLVVVHRPDVIVYEAPLPPNRQRNTDTARKLFTLAGIAEMVAYENRCRAEDIDVKTVRRHFVGNGGADKPIIMEVCQKRGWTPGDLDASDALAVLDWAVCLKRSQYQRKGGLAE